MSDGLFNAGEFELPQTALTPRDFFCPRCFAPRGASCRTSMSGMARADHTERVMVVHRKREMLAALPSPRQEAADGPR